MKRHFFLFIFCLVFSSLSFAQPVPCGPDAAMTPTCIEACVICDIDGFTGINASSASGEAPDDFCTTTVHNAQWIAFIAGSENLTIELEVFNCDGSGPGGGFVSGLEVGIYESLDCENFLLVSNCDGDIEDGTTGVFTTTEPLTIGQYYYWVMDGNGGDVCNYTITVTEGTTEVPPLPPAGNITIDAPACIEDTMSFSIPPIVGANFYSWEIDGQPNLTTSPTLDLLWNVGGVHEVCVTAFNVCDTIDPVCVMVDVPMSLTTNLDVDICPDECFEVGDSIFCEPGDYQVMLESFEGCDSLVNLSLGILPAIEVNFEVTICETDSIEVAGTVFYPPGNFQVTTTSYLGCDSVINLTLNSIVCVFEGAIESSSVICHGEETGSINFMITSGNPLFIYQWERLGGNPTGAGTLATTNVNETIPNLPAGTYIVTVFDAFGATTLVLTVNVSEPPPLVVEFLLSDFNGSAISCAGAMNGSVETQVSGGTPDYSFQWNNGGQDANLTGLTAGIYELTLTDGQGCSLVESVSLIEPDSLDFDAVFENPDCGGFNTGSILATNVFGGTEPYLYQLSGGTFGVESVFDNLPGGDYTLTVQDANGCEASENGSLQTPVIPVIEVVDEVTINLAESTTINVSSNILPDFIQWTPGEGLSCDDCLSPTANPFETTTYSVLVASADGCVDSAAVTVNVVKVRNIYAPNVFSPNGDGINDSFTLFGGDAATEIVRLKIFSRWGEELFDGANLPLNDLNVGWDGTFRGEQMQPGVFTWFAEVGFVDGEILLYEGDVTLVR